MGSLVGQTISHYSILEKIGQSGVGEVYRAEDTQLKRQVTIRVLSKPFTRDPKRLARLRREAKLLSSLHHPNIAAIYGLEEAEGVRLLSQELVEGKTLAERLTQGPLPLQKALEACRQMAEGVEAAHKKGVIHRDLTPSKVKITPPGQVKILDFGLARAFEGATRLPGIFQSSTLRGEITQAGMALGRAAYMSPEQAKGEPVDERTDIWSLGCVLYELLTGKRAFPGETVIETLARVLESEPDWSGLPDNTPGSVRSLLQRSLRKDPGRRLQHVGRAPVTEDRWR